MSDEFSTVDRRGRVSDPVQTTRCEGRNCFHTEGAADRAAEALGIHAYPCDLGPHWHIGRRG